MTFVDIKIQNYKRPLRTLKKHTENNGIDLHAALLRSHRSYVLSNKMQLEVIRGNYEVIEVK